MNGEAVKTRNFPYDKETWKILPSCWFLPKCLYVDCLFYYPNVGAVTVIFFLPADTII